MLLLPAGVGAPRGLPKGFGVMPTAPPCHMLAPFPPHALPTLVAGVAGCWGHCGQALTASPPLPTAGKTPEDVVRRYIQKVKNPPDEVSGHPLAPQLGHALTPGLLEFRGSWAWGEVWAGDGQPPIPPGH